MALKALDQRVASASPAPQRASNGSAVPSRPGPSTAAQPAAPATSHDESSADVADTKSDSR